MCDAVLEFVATSEKGTVRRSAGGADVEVLETHAPGTELVEVWRFEDWIAVGGDVTVAWSSVKKKITLGRLPAMPSAWQNASGTSNRAAKRRVRMDVMVLSSLVQVFVQGARNSVLQGYRQQWL